ncbi:hypothetical protein Taro_014370 [Colocasia esculenta]|uniref:Synaptonemal complex protein 1 n=1 Tax=Colocasia esculenta TaxID=4460 RepID=A0A843UPY6_COLES|nr:hypothetical protein [Colocasia esculenta]
MLAPSSVEHKAVAHPASWSVLVPREGLPLGEVPLAYSTAPAVECDGREVRAAAALGFLSVGRIHVSSGLGSLFLVKIHLLRVMQKPGNLGLKSLDQLRFARGPAVGPSKTAPVMNSRPSSDLVSLGAFANLKLTAEKLIKEQASVKTDLEMANSKLKKSAEQMHILEFKLQEAMNENAKLKVKHKEDAKLWNGVDSKLSSTKMLCDQLTETLQHLASCTRDAEQDKCSFEEKVLESSRAFDGLDCQLNELSAKLDNAEETIRNGKQEVIKLEHEKQEINEKFKEQCHLSNILMKERDAVAKELKDTVEANKVHLQSLISQTEELQHELESKENTCVNLTRTVNNLEDEKNVLLSSNENFSRQLHISSKETKGLEDVLHGLWKKVEEMDKQSSTVSNNAIQLLSSFDTFERLIRQEKDLVMKNAQQKFDQLHDKLHIVISENEFFKSEAEILRNKIVELQKTQEYIMVQHAEECRLVEDKVRKLESGTNSLVLKKSELELLVTQLKEKNSHLLEVQNLTGSELHDSLTKASILESENQDIKTKMQMLLLEKAEEMNNLQNEVAKNRQHILSQEDEINKLQTILHEKDQQILQCCEREKLLGEQKSEIQASLASAECGLREAKKQYDLMLETKQLELSRHLKEISLRNDQAINDIKRKYEIEKLEVVNIEKEKIEKLIQDMERKCDEKLAESKREAEQHLDHIQEEHDALVNQLNKEYEKKESNLRAFHNEELQRIQLQAESELREKTSIMRKEHEMQMQVLGHDHEDECRKLQEELDILKSKEDKQRALLHLQWKVMDERSQQNDVEVSSKKVANMVELHVGLGVLKLKRLRLSQVLPESGCPRIAGKRSVNGLGNFMVNIVLQQENSVSSMKMRDMDVQNRSQLAQRTQESARKEVDLSGIMRTPVANMLKKMENGNKGNAINIPKHSKKVMHSFLLLNFIEFDITHHEYEIETSNGRTVTKRRKTKSTVMFGDPTIRKNASQKTPKAVEDVKRQSKVFNCLSFIHTHKGAHVRPSNVGDLFSEGSLNPYADDPYAFD